MPSCLFQHVLVSNSRRYRSRLIPAYLGYTLSALQETSHSLTAKLSLAGPACNAFGTDISNLTIEVVYESKER